MNKNLEIFQKELDSFEFKEESIYEFTKAALLALPDYFWEPTESGAENGIITHTKTAMSFANSLLEMEKYKSQFNEFSRDQIRSAILLHDGLIYLDGSEHKIQPEHPYYIGEYIKNPNWDSYLPEFVRNSIADMAAAHSGKRYKKNGVELFLPKDDEAWFVCTCIYLASRKETTVGLPCLPKIKDDRGMDFQTAIQIVNEMTMYRNWDGYVYEEIDGNYIYLDNQKIPVAAYLYDAFIMVGQERISVYHSREHLKNLEWEEFFQWHPEWDQKVYGQRGSYFIVDAYGECDISDVQAEILGIKE